ncbi:MAG: peptide-methionine (R)-S-oxide reductase MsrB [Acidobacteriota bacterium]
MAKRVIRSEEEWKTRLTAEQYRVCRQKGTEPAFSGAFCRAGPAGVYRCVCCGSELFASESQFDSGSGWPSFTAPIRAGNIQARTDQRHLMRRTEVQCATCDAHLGHVFADGPPPTGLRYCINSVALKLDQP